MRWLNLICKPLKPEDENGVLQRCVSIINTDQSDSDESFQ